MIGLEDSPDQPTVSFADRLWQVRKRFLIGEAIFFAGGAMGLAACWYASHREGDPGPVIYLFPVSFAIVLGTFPTLAYLGNRWIRQFDVATCPFCHNFLWPTTLHAVQLATLARCPRCWRRLSKQSLDPDPWDNGIASSHSRIFCKSLRLRVTNTSGMRMWNDEWGECAYFREV
jgi:hypothetical protein